ncbi:MAG TPA: (S)-ureidoglycine aminohydrolase [Bryobacteraceae bacterium]|jgi:(S)-ureidoglycine aminohydrolase|nr:(S)-ureidoglycine aminohydrolase [Bryobacteraceae bacterium]
MQRLGYTRSSRQQDHLLLTPDTFIRAPLPGMRRATAVVHVSSAMGAGFTQYTAEFEAGGALAPTGTQRFVYVIEGELTAGDRRLAAGDYCYLAAAQAAHIEAAVSSRAAVIEKAYKPLEKTPPCILTGRESDLEPKPLMGDEALAVRVLLPDDFAFDFAVNTMTFQPGAALPMVEIHVMEHGLLMLEGGGIYRLGESWYPVAAGDFIWMAPYCPQWFGALGKVPAKYLIYKDWNRHPLE